MKVFRVTTISQDEAENVDGVTAIASPRAVRVASELLGREIDWTVLSETEHQVTLPVAELLDLFHACGKLTGLDPRHDVTGPIFDSLARVVYPLIENY